MNTQTNHMPLTQNERIMAALAHITAVLPMMGIIAPIVIWVTQKDKSEFVAFQALQAIAYQLVMILAWLAGMVLYMGSFLATFLTIPFDKPSASVPIFFFVPFLVMGLMMLGTLVFIVYGLVAAVSVLQGNNFRYIFLGNRLKHWLDPK